MLKYRVPHGSHFKPAAFYQFLKTKIGLAAAKAATGDVLWEGCYPASALAHGVCVLVYV